MMAAPIDNFEKGEVPLEPREAETDKENLPFIGGSLNPFTKKVSEIEDNFPEFLEKTCCPSFTFLSTTFILSMIQILLYIITVCYGIRKDDDMILLGPKISKLNQFGMLNPEKLHRGQVWRVITSVFLHSDFIHLFYNIITQIILGSYIETILGQSKTIYLILFTSIASGFFSSCVSKSVGVTSSHVQYMILGGYLAYTVLNNASLDKKIGRNNKLFNLLFVLFLICMNIIVGYKNPILLSYCNLSSLIFSFFFSLTIIVPYSEGGSCLFSPKVWFWIGMGFSIAVPVLEIILFYTLIKF